MFFNFLAKPKLCQRPIGESDGFPGWAISSSIYLYYPCGGAQRKKFKATSGKESSNKDKEDEEDILFSNLEATASIETLKKYLRQDTDC